MSTPHGDATTWFQELTHHTPACSLAGLQACSSHVKHLDLRSMCGITNICSKQRMLICFICLFIYKVERMKRMGSKTATELSLHAQQHKAHCYSTVMSCHASQPLRQYIHIYHNITLCLRVETFRPSIRILIH